MKNLLTAASLIPPAFIDKILLLIYYLSWNSSHQPRPTPTRSSHEPKKGIGYDILRHWLASLTLDNHRH